MKIAYVDHSVKPLSDSDIARLGEDCFVQLCEAAGYWNLAAPVSYRIAKVGDTLDADEYEVGRFDTADQPRAAGYHTVDPHGKPYGKWFINTCDALFSGGTMAEQTVASHESLELWGDCFANRYAMRNDRKTFDAVELCDACEDVTYPSKSGGAMSDYLLPAAFDPGLAGPWDKLSALSGPYDTTPGGYRITATSAVEDDGTSSFRTLAVYGPRHAFARDVSEPHIVERRQAKFFIGSHASARDVENWIPEGEAENYLAAPRYVPFPIDAACRAIDQLARKTMTDKDVEQFIDELSSPPPPYVKLTTEEEEALRERIRVTLATGKVAPKIAPVVRPNERPAPLSAHETLRAKIRSTLKSGAPIPAPANIPFPVQPTRAPTVFAGGSPKTLANNRPQQLGRMPTAVNLKAPIAPRMPLPGVTSKRPALPVARGDKTVGRAQREFPTFGGKPVPQALSTSKIHARVPQQGPVKPNIKVIQQRVDRGEVFESKTPWDENRSVRDRVEEVTPLPEKHERITIPEMLSEVTREETQSDE